MKEFEGCLCLGDVDVDGDIAVYENSSISSGGALGYINKDHSIEIINHLISEFKLKKEDVKL